VIDFRTKKRYETRPLPNITEILDQLESAKYFRVFDLIRISPNIDVRQTDAQKTAFTTPHGHYQFNRIPFGLKNASVTFQRLIDQILSGVDQKNDIRLF